MDNDEQAVVDEELRWMVSCALYFDMLVILPAAIFSRSNVSCSFGVVTSEVRRRDCREVDVLHGAYNIAYHNVVVTQKQQTDRGEHKDERD